MTQVCLIFILKKYGSGHRLNQEKKVGVWINQKKKRNHPKKMIKKNYIEAKQSKKILTTNNINIE
jgi:hypothetical protein